MFAMNTKVSTVGDKSSCFGTPFLPSNVMPSNPNEGITTSESCSNVATLFPNQVSAAILWLQQIPKSVLLETSPVVWVHCFCQVMSCPPIRMRVLLQVDHAPMWLQSFQNLVSTANPIVAMNTKFCIVQDKSNCLGTPFLPNNVVPSNQNMGVTTSESCSNVASIIQKTDVKNNPIVAMNTKVSTIGYKSSSWGTPFSPSNVMPSYQNKCVTTSESCSSMATVIPKSFVIINHTVGMNTKVSTVGDKLSSWGTLWSLNNANLSNLQSK